MKPFIVALLAVLSLAACKSEIDNKPAAQVEEPTTEKPAEEKPAETAKSAASAVNLVAEKSSVGFVGANVAEEHVGGFKVISGKGMAGDKGLESLEINVDTTSAFTDKEKLTGHLKSPDFFDVAKFPEAKFVSKEITAAAGEGKTHDVKGDMTLRGVTKTITFPATLSEKDGMVVAQAEFTLMRFDFGVAYKGKADNLIKDEVLMKLNLAFDK